MPRTATKLKVKPAPEIREPIEIPPLAPAPDWKQQLAAAAAPDKKARSVESNQPDDAVKKVVDEWLKLKGDLENLEVKLERQRHLILAYAEPILNGKSRAKREIVTSVDVESSGLKAVRVSVQKRYKAIEPDKIHLIQREAGALFANLFMQKFEVGLSDDALRDDDFMREFTKLAGQKAGYVTLKECYKPTDDYHRGRVLDEAVAVIAARIEAIGLAKPTVVVAERKEK